MPITAFGADEFDQVRAAIDLRLSADMLTNDTIAQDIFEAQARRWVESQVSDSVITGNMAVAQSAAIFYTAGLIFPSIVHQTHEDIPGGTMQFQNRDLSKLAAERIAMAANIVGQLIALEPVQPTVTPNLPNVFVAADAPVR